MIGKFSIQHRKKHSNFLKIHWLFNLFFYFRILPCKVATANCWWAFWSTITSRINATTVPTPPSKTTCCSNSTIFTNNNNSSNSTRPISIKESRHQSIMVNLSFVQFIFYITLENCMIFWRSTNKDNLFFCDPKNCTKLLYFSFFFFYINIYLFCYSILSLVVKNWVRSELQNRENDEIF